MEKLTGWTYDDFRNIPDDGYRYELFDGFIVREPPPSRLHQRIVTRLIFAFGDQLGPRRREGLLTSPIAVVLSDRTVLQPDLLYISHERSQHLNREDAVDAAPELVVEVLSPSTRDRDLTAKRSLYAQFGVREYWVVDPTDQLILVFEEPSGGCYEKVSQYSVRDVVRSPSLGCSVSVGELFAL